MRLDCIAEHYCELISTSDLPLIKSFLDQNQTRYFILGGGSNILLPENYDGLVIHNHINGIALIGQTSDFVIVKAMAGVIWDEFVSYCVHRGYYGLENLSLIPGTVGATPIQNIGAYGIEVKDFIEYVECFDLNTGQTIQIQNKDCEFSYRNSRFKKEPNLLVVAVVFNLSKTAQLNTSYGDIANKMSRMINPTALDLRNCIIETRKSKLPNPELIANVGSFFHNPILANKEVENLKLQYPNVPVYKVDDNYAKVSAGWLIDNLGFKGFKYKNVGVYEKQALVLVNYSAKRCSEILELAEIIQNEVFAKTQIRLNIEPIRL